MKICIINPNSSEEMTKVILDNARSFDPEIQVDCIRNGSAPAFIGSYEDMAESVPGMIRIVKERQEEYDAFIVACHSDPGLDVLKEISDRPVVGICEASVKLATMLGHSFSVISTGQRPIPNKQALCRKYGVWDSVASVAGPEGLRADWHSEESFIETGRRGVGAGLCRDGPCDEEDGSGTRGTGAGRGGMCADRGLRPGEGRADHQQGAQIPQPGTGVRG